MSFSEFLLVFGGGWFLIGTIGIFTFVKEAMKPYEIVNGKVSGYRRKTREGKTRYRPMFEYSYNGVVYQSEHRIGSAKYGKGFNIEPNSKYKIGDTVRLRVYLDKPKHAIADDKWNIRMPILLGTLMCMVGVALMTLSVYI